MPLIVHQIVMTRKKTEKKKQPHKWWLSQLFPLARHLPVNRHNAKENREKRNNHANGGCSNYLMAPIIWARQDQLELITKTNRHRADIVKIVSKEMVVSKRGEIAVIIGF